MGLVLAGLAAMASGSRSDGGRTGGERAGLWSFGALSVRAGAMALCCWWCSASLARFKAL